MECGFPIRVVIVAILVMFSVSSNAQVICNVAVNSLLTCRPAVTLPNPKAPTVACCTAVRQADFKCLCAYRGSLKSLGIDVGLVYQLPKKCNINKAINC